MLRLNIFHGRKMDVAIFRHLTPHQHVLKKECIFSTGYLLREKKLHAQDSPASQCPCLLTPNDSYAQLLSTTMVKSNVF